MSSRCIDCGVLLDHNERNGESPYCQMCEEDAQERGTQTMSFRDDSDLPSWGDYDRRRQDGW